MSLDQWDCKQEENARLKRAQGRGRKPHNRKGRENLALLKHAIDN